MVEILQESGLMPFVRFERVAFENPTASLEAGRYVAVDVDMAHITPPYSKDVITLKVKNWFEQLRIDAQNGRFSPDWVDKYKAAYEAWKSGQELPVDGFPIRGWGVCSPAQQETLIKMHILTVEQLAQVNDEGLRRIGMGAVDLKNKADAWLKQMAKGGKSTMEIAALRKENDQLKAAVAGLEKQVKELSSMVTAATIDADDILGD